MANSSYGQKSLSSFALLTFFLLLLNVVNSAEKVSFEFTKFQKVQENLIFQGDAFVNRDELVLTNEHKGVAIYHSVGRALYSAPIHIWDSQTEAIASFSTNFSFVINAIDKTKTADGLAFFLAPVDTKLPHTEQGLLGIFSNLPTAGVAEPIVAVEFDSFTNHWDPEGHHIGIDVQSIKSKSTRAWDWLNGDVASVSINYNAVTSYLTVSLVYPSGSSSTLRQRVDLTDVLPPWVRVGFSATTGSRNDLIETHHILSWSFSSNLQDYSSTTKGSHNYTFAGSNHLKSYV